MNCQRSHQQAEADPGAQTGEHLAQIAESVQMVQCPGRWRLAGPGCPGPWAQCPCWLSQTPLTLAEQLQQKLWHALLCSRPCSWYCGPLKRQQRVSTTWHIPWAEHLGTYISIHALPTTYHYVPSSVGNGTALHSL